VLRCHAKNYSLNEDCELIMSANSQAITNHRYADIFPMMNEDDFNRLMEDVRENGLQEPIWLYEGKILDGRNRYKACQTLGIVPELRNYQGTKPLEFVLSLNLARRHLNSSQLAFVALEVQKALAEEAKQRQLKKNEWIAQARKSFILGVRDNCYVCGGYKGVAEAHHTVPLYWQYDAGIGTPIQHSIWLCPTHHKITHICGESMLTANMPIYCDASLTERDAIDGVVSIWLAASIKHSNPLKNKNSFVLEVENKWGLSL